ncbi:MAG: intein-containing RctB family protein [Elusimicrobia bacterium]|nr:intein-containing RctB family protein [Elusimicrobiota bacterium]
MTQCPLKKVDDYRWKIEKTGAMNTEGLIFASEKMVSNICNDNATQQVANVAALPGILGKSLAMPDIHWGYGFPIGGVAAFSLNDGVISPGGIGYDINCLSGDTKVLHELGFTLRIKDYEQIWQKEKIVCIDFNKDTSLTTNIEKFLKFKPKNRVYKIKTKSGLEIIATEDHPFYTEDGMIPVSNLKEDKEVAVYNFKGVTYEKPSDDIIVDEKDVERKLLELCKVRGNTIKQVMNQLKKRNLLPLKYNSPQLPYLLKIMGYVFGDGNIHFVGKTGKGVTSFYGEKENLEKIRDDIFVFGYECSKVYQRQRNHKIKTLYKEYSFQTIESCCMSRSSSLAILLILLGTPVGNKTLQNYSVPEWIFKATLWQKRLFLAAFFGAEMSSPKTLTKHGYNFYLPTVSMNKNENYLDSGRTFLEQIAELLNEFDVETNTISCRMEYIGKEKKKSHRFRLQLSNQYKTLINLYSKIGFEYNQKRQFLANVAVNYLQEKEKLVIKREKIAQYALSLKKQGLSAGNIYDMLEQNDREFVNFRFIERSVYEGRKGSPRVAFKFYEFDEFVKQKTSGLGTSGMVWDKIMSKEEIKFNDYVYDFTVSHHHHNFIANNFVVSNCGVRLLRTNLSKKDISKHIKNLVAGFFTNIPSGVGSTGKLNLSTQEVKSVLEKGAKWATDKGFGEKSDLESIEEKGMLNGADSSNVSKRAIERGQEQLGTLGAGNHFLEIQEVVEVYDESISQKLGIFLGQITIMIHTGSRGLGYQVCDDYIKVMLSAARKYGINLPDKQLACAPVLSDEGKKYFSAMASAANYAFANRQIITHWIRETFMKILSKSPNDLGLETVYDVAHNIGKFEEHFGKKIFIHRKGATCSFPGIPVLIPGTMGTASYVLVGTEQALKETWGSTCHGAGRVMSRTQALRGLRGNELAKQLEGEGIVVQAKEWKTLAEEAPTAYKDVNLVVDVCHKAGISKKVAKMKPLGVVKG